MAPVSAAAPHPRDRPIAVFDSGVGGLTVLQELLVELPHEDFLYLGDTARFPYGERSAEELERFSLEIGELLLTRRAKLLVVACNAASAAALGALLARLLSTTRRSKGKPCWMIGARSGHATLVSSASGACAASACA